MALQQKTDFTAFDTLVIKPGVPLTRLQLFNRQGRPANLTNLLLPVQQGHKYEFEYLKSYNGLVVKPIGATEPAVTALNREQILLEWQREFEATSHLSYSIQNVEFAQIPLASMLPYNIERVGGIYRVTEKPMLQLYKLLDKLVVEQGSVDVFFNPAARFETCSAAYASSLPAVQSEPGFTPTDVGYIMQLFMRGTITRPIASYVNQQLPA